MVDLHRLVAVGTEVSDKCWGVTCGRRLAVATASLSSGEAPGVLLLGLFVPWPLWWGDGVAVGVVSASGRGEGCWF